MKRISLRLLLSLRPISMLSNKGRFRLFRAAKYSSYFKRLWKRNLKWFAGSQYPIWVLHKDGKFQRGNVLYYPVPGNFQKALVELWEGGKYERGRIKMVELPIEYIYLTKRK